MSSAKSDKILQESEKILTNPAETGRIYPIFPDDQGAMRLGLSSCSKRRECAAFRVRGAAQLRKKAPPKRRF